MITNYCLFITVNVSERQEEIARQNNILLKRMENILMNENKTKLFKGRKKSVEGLYKNEISAIEKEDYAMSINVPPSGVNKGGGGKFKRWASHARNEKDPYSLTDQSASLDKHGSTEVVVPQDPNKTS